MDRALHWTNFMTTTTIGQLVASLFAKYEDRFHDEKQAAVATQQKVDQLRRARCQRDERRRVTRG